MKVTHMQLVDMVVKYERLLATLPVELQVKCPRFTNFLSPVGWSHFYSNNDTEELSITGAKRWRMLESPHARTLLLAWALQHFSPENDNEGRCRLDVPS
jgi:hypothetical protein